MSGVDDAHDHGIGESSVLPSDSRDDGRGTSGTRRESSGTMQLLDRLGHGLFSLPTCPSIENAGGGEREIRRTGGQQGEQHAVRNEEGDGLNSDKTLINKAAGSRQDSTDTSYSAHSALLPPRREHQQLILSPRAAEDVASLDRIRALVSVVDGHAVADVTGQRYGHGVGSDMGGCGYGEPRKLGEFTDASATTVLSAERRSSSPHDAIAVFKGLRILLQQNTTGAPQGSEEVALECLSVLKDAVAWLSLTHDESHLNQQIPGGRHPQTLRTRQTAQLQGPGHKAHAATACIASTAPSVIDCSSMASLRRAAEDVLAKCVVGQNLPDMSRILVEQLVEHGMEHDDSRIRLWSTLAPTRLMARGMKVKGCEYSCLLNALVGRLRDVDYSVVKAAAEALSDLHLANPEKFLRGEVCLDPERRRLLRDHNPSIRSDLGRKENDFCRGSVDGEARHLGMRDKREGGVTGGSGNVESDNVDDGTQVRDHGPDDTPSSMASSAQGEKGPRRSESRGQQQQQNYSLLPPFAADMRSWSCETAAAGSGGLPGPGGDSKGWVDAIADNDERHNDRSLSRSMPRLLPPELAPSTALVKSSSVECSGNPDDIRPLESEPRTGDDLELTDSDRGNHCERGSDVPCDPYSLATAEGVIPQKISEVGKDHQTISRCIARDGSSRQETEVDTKQGKERRAAQSHSHDEMGGAVNHDRPAQSPPADMVAATGRDRNNSDDDDDNCGRRRSYSHLPILPTLESFCPGRLLHALLHVEELGTDTSGCDEDDGGKNSVTGRERGDIHQGSSSHTLPSAVKRSEGNLTSASGRVALCLTPRQTAQGMTDRQFSIEAPQVDDATPRAGTWRCRRVQAMEDAKALLFSDHITRRRGDRAASVRGEPSAVSPTPTPLKPLLPVALSARYQVDGLLDAALRLVDDRDFKIVILALEILHALVQLLEAHLQPRLSPLMQSLMTKLGDHKVAARHHAMAVLSAILRKVGIARCVPHLVEYGLCCSAAWRTQEGSLKLVVAGLLQGNENGEARGEGEQSAGEVHRKGYHAGERAADETGPMHAEICRNYIGVLDKERLVRSVGALLGAERPEVRSHAVEALAVTAHVLRGSAERIDILLILEKAGLLRSDETRRHLTARLQQPFSPAHRTERDEIVDTSPGSTACRPPDVAPAVMSCGAPPIAAAGVLVDVVSSPDNDAIVRVSAHTTRSGCADSGDAPDGSRGQVEEGRRRQGRALRSPPPSSTGNPAPTPSPRLEERTDRDTVLGRGMEGKPGGVSAEGRGTRSLRCWRRCESGELRQTSPWRCGRGEEERPRDAEESHLGERYDGTGHVRGEGEDARYVPSWAESDLSQTPSDNIRENQLYCHPRSLQQEERKAVLVRERRRQRRQTTDTTADLVSLHRVGDDFDDRDGTGDIIRSGKPAVPTEYIPGQQRGDEINTSRAPDKLGTLSPEVFDRSRRRRTYDESQDQYQQRERRGHDMQEDRHMKDGTWRRVYSPGVDDDRDDDSESVVGGKGRERAWGRELRGRKGSPIPDPSLLSTLKRGGSRNTRASRRAVSAAAVGGGGALSSGAGGGDPAASYGGGGARSRADGGGAPAGPTTPVPVGKYDGTGRRRHMETTVQQTLPLARGVVGSVGADGRQMSEGKRMETFVTATRTEDDELNGDGGRNGERQHPRRPRQDLGRGGEDTSSPSARETPAQEGGEDVRVEPNGFDDTATESGISSATRRRRDIREAGQARIERGSSAFPQHSMSMETDSSAASWVRDRLEGSGDKDHTSGIGDEVSLGRDPQRIGRVSRAARGAGHGRNSQAKSGGGGRGGSVVQPASSSALKADSFDYLTPEDIRPSPHPTQELQRALSSLPRDSWPEIFHTLNSVRRLAAHHVPLLGSQPLLHALVRDVLGQAENLRSQVAKNALLTLRDLWRGLGDMLDPELPMVCPVFVKKMADKVEFLAEVARECVDEVVATATSSRALSAFLACGTHRSPTIRAKSALAILLCIQRRYHTARDTSASECSTTTTTTTPATARGRGSNGFEGGGGCGISSMAGGGRGVGVSGGGTVSGSGGIIGTREMDRLLSALPRFLQDGNQETRLHAKELVTLLLDSGEIDEARLRREIPPPILERLHRDLLHSALPAGRRYPAAEFDVAAQAGRSDTTPGARRRLSRRGVECGNADTVRRRSSCGRSRWTTENAEGGERHFYDDDGSLEIYGRGSGRSDVHGGSSVSSSSYSSPRRRVPPRARSGMLAQEQDQTSSPGQDGLCSPSDHRRGRRKEVREGGHSHATAEAEESRLVHDSYANGGRGDARRDDDLRGQGADPAVRSVSKSTSSLSGGKSSGVKAKRPKAVYCREADSLPSVFDALDSSDWRERIRGLEEATTLLDDHGDSLHAAGKSSRLIDRMAELLADGNLKVNLMALDGVVQLASTMGEKLECVANTLVPAVCKNLASSNHQRTASAEEALEVLCGAIDPCLIIQPVASLAQFGNARLKVPMLALLRDLTPEIGRMRPILLTKYVRPAALSVVRENRPNLRGAGLSLLRAIEAALCGPALPTRILSSGSDAGGSYRSSFVERSERSRRRRHCRSGDGCEVGRLGAGTHESGTRRRQIHRNLSSSAPVPGCNGADDRGDMYHFDRRNCDREDVGREYSGGTDMARRTRQR